MSKGRIKRPEGQSLKLPRVGMIKTGFKNAKGHPQSVDHFIATGKYKAIFDKYYPGKPKTVQVVFWEDDPSTMCEERFEYRDSQGKLFARGDGEIFEVWHAKKEQYVSYSVSDHPFIQEEIHDKQKSKGWDVILTLRFILPKVKDIAGYWEYSTRGEKSTIPGIRDTYDAMMQSRGSVRGVIFDLNVTFAKSQKPGVKSRYPVVSLVPNQSQENIDAVKGTLLNVRDNNLLSE